VSVNCASPSEIPNAFQELQKRLKTLQTEKQEAEAKYAKLEHNFINRNRRTSEEISSIQRLRLQNRNLQNQVAVLELSLQTKEAVNASMRFEGPPEVDPVVAELEEQIRSLTIELEQSRDSAETIAKKLAKTKEQLGEMKQLFFTETESLKQRLKDQKTKDKHKIRSLASQFQQELQSSAVQLDESKHSFEANFEKLKERMEESRGISNDRIRALEESEQKCQRLGAENARLQLLERTCNLKVSSLEEQLAKERRMAQTQIAAQRLAFESQLHELASRMQNRLDEAAPESSVPSKQRTDPHLPCGRAWPLVNIAE
jgi:chromosome segregation protein